MERRALVECGRDRGSLCRRFWLVESQARLSRMDVVAVKARDVFDHPAQAAPDDVWRTIINIEIHAPAAVLLASGFGGVRLAGVEDRAGRHVHAQRQGRVGRRLRQDRSRWHDVQSCPAVCSLLRDVGHHLSIHLARPIL